MLDLVLKYLPLLVFMAPFLVWLDKAKRFAHRRKFFVERLDAVKTYLSEIKREGITKFEKDCAAQILACSEKVDHRQVNYVIEHYPQRFFILINKLITARHLVDTKELDSKIILTAESTKARWKKVRVILALFYFSSLIVLHANQISLLIIENIRFVNPIEVSNLWMLIGFFIQVVLAILIAIFSWFLFWEVDAAIEIYDDLNVQYIPKDEPTISTIN